RTTTHSAQGLLAFVLFYLACLLPYGLRGHVENQEHHWAVLAMKCVPLLLAVAAAAAVLSTRIERRYQAPPWVYAGAVLLMGIGYGLALTGLEDWWPALDPKQRKPLSFLLLSLIGGVQTVVGVKLRSWLRHRSRLAPLLVVFGGRVSPLPGLVRAGGEDVWPEKWPTVWVLGEHLPWPHAVLPLTALTVTLLACRYQMVTFLLVGLCGVAFSVHMLGEVYFRDA